MHALLFKALGLVRVFNVLKELSHTHQGYIYLKAQYGRFSTEITWNNMSQELLSPRPVAVYISFVV